MKRTIEIDDSLDDTVENVKSEIRDNFLEYIEQNPDIKDFDEYYQSQGCDAVHEISDSNTPIYYSEIDGLYYLYGGEFDEAYNNAGIGDGKEDNHKQVAIYCYLSEQGFDYLRDLEEQFDEYINDESETKKITDYIKAL